MPFTPIHMGPGMLVKAALPRHFSIITFGLAQVALDLEVFWHLVRHESPLHRICHTFLGATIAAAILAAVGRPANQLAKSLWNRVAARCRDADLSVPVRTTWIASILGAALGAWSHVLLDGLFHSDAEPFRPWSDRNPLIGLVDPTFLQVACAIAGAAGLAWFLWREAGARKESKAGDQQTPTATN